MNKLTMMGLSLIIGLSLVSGCATSNIQNDQLVYNAGYTAATIWVAKQEPSQETKQNIVDTCKFIDSLLNETNKVSSYSKVLMPYVNTYIDKSDSIKVEDKPIAKVASLYALTCIDGLIAQVNTSNITSNVGYIYAKQFTEGFIVGISCDTCSVETRYILENSYKASVIK